MMTPTRTRTPILAFAAIALGLARRRRDPARGSPRCARGHAGADVLGIAVAVGVRDGSALDPRGRGPRVLRGACGRPTNR